jgi:RIO kinase 1
MTHNEHDVLLGLMDSFLDDSLVLRVLEVVQSGKEATVFRCEAAPSTGKRFFAAKVYRPMNRRNFRNDSVYQQGRVILNGHDRRAFARGSEFGKHVQQTLWVLSEFETQRMLFDAGADVPQPIKFNGNAILMEWLGDDASPAVQLRHAELREPEAGELCERLLANIELMLRHNIVHADLSPFNILYLGNGIGVKIIDFPQAVDARTNPAAPDLLRRDVENVCRHFQRFGIDKDAVGIAAGLWRRFVLAEL